MVLSQARFAHPDLHQLIDELFQEDTCKHLRRGQGLVRKAFTIIKQYGRPTSTEWIAGAVAQMKRFGRVRVQHFEELIKAEMKKTVVTDDRNIVRQPGNPMVRGHGTRKPEGETQTVPSQLRLV
jgi:hypothetical protein